MTMERAISRDLGIPRYWRFRSRNDVCWRKYHGISGICVDGARVCCRVLQEGQGSSVGSLTALVVHGGALGGILYGILSSTWKASSTDMYDEHRREYIVGMGGKEDGFETAVRWSVMSILSCVPYVNYMAWVFAALDSSSSSMMNESKDDKRSSVHYWTLAAIYALPYLIDGFHMDSFTLLSLSIGVMHVQLERGLYYGDLDPWFGSAIQSLMDTLNINGSRSESDYELLDIDEGILKDLEDFDKRLGATTWDFPDTKSMDESEWC